jgi:hypothetical protein
MPHHAPWVLRRAVQVRQPQRQHVAQVLYLCNTHFLSASSLGAHIPLSEQRKYKYTLNTDGFTASVRFAKLLAM